MSLEVSDSCVRLSTWYLPCYLPDITKNQTCMLSLVPRFPWFARRKPSVHNSQLSEHVWVSSASFHAYQQSYLFPIFFCESDDTLFTTGPLFHEFIDFLVEFSGCLLSRCAWFVRHVVYSTKKSYRQPTRWKDNRGVLETDPSFDWLVTSTSMSCAMVLRGKTKMAHRFFYTLSRFGWSLFSVSNLF